MLASASASICSCFARALFTCSCTATGSARSPPPSVSFCTREMSFSIRLRTQSWSGRLSSKKRTSCPFPNNLFLILEAVDCSWYSDAVMVIVSCASRVWGKEAERRRRRNAPFEVLESPSTSSPTTARFALGVAAERTRKHR